jgi:hypothetical protein
VIYDVYIHLPTHFPAAKKKHSFYHGATATYIKNVFVIGDWNRHICKHSIYPVNYYLSTCTSYTLKIRETIKSHVIGYKHTPTQHTTQKQENKVHNQKKKNKKKNCCLSTTPEALNSKV